MIVKNKAWLAEQILSKRSFLCVGLDSDISRLPSSVLSSDNPVLTFNKHIIDHTKDLCVAYKINTAFYESLGVKGWEAFQATVNYIPSTHLIIADAKRGDIGNTSLQYAKAFFEEAQCDAITVAPYMGEDSLKPFLSFEEKWTIILALTSNKGSKDFQMIEDTEGIPLYNQVLERTQSWGTEDQIMYVVGATKPEYLSEIRKTIPNHFLLVPGVGAQGGDLEKVFNHGANADVGLLVNSSRGIIFSSSKPDFAQAARTSALRLQSAMQRLLESKF